MSGASGSRSSGVIGRAVGHHLHEVFSLFAPPHDNPPSLAGEGDPIPSAQKQAHFPSTWRRGKEGTRGREKEPTPRVPREVDRRAGAFSYPFRGREESCKHIQAMCDV
eukprot:scaffold18381_cov124-Isochrysis_galbana.AAC.2